MQKQINDKKGITLIALVITIIVLLILAGVTIATLTGDNGLLQKAQTASEKNTEASALEKIQVEVAGSYGIDGKIDKTQLVNNLKKISGIKYNNSNIDENTSISSFPVAVKLDGYAFTIFENGNIDKVQWVDNNDGSYTNAETGYTLNVGDTVKYETILNKTENAVNGNKLAQLKTDLQHYSGDSSSTDNANIARDNLTWKVLDIKDGKIRLISSTSTISKMSFYNANGYNNAVYLIDKACDILYSVEGVGKVQNLKIEDIEEKFKIVDGKTARENYTNTAVTPNLKYGDEREYTSNLKYPNIYPSEIGYKATSTTADNTENKIGLSSQESLVTGSSTASSKLKVAQTYWNKSMDISDFIYSKYYNLFINNGSNYPTFWLSSRCVQCGVSDAYFAVRYVNEGIVRAFSLFYRTVLVKVPLMHFVLLFLLSLISN